MNSYRRYRVLLKGLIDSTKLPPAELVRGLLSQAAHLTMPGVRLREERRYAADEFARAARETWLRVARQRAAGSED